MSEIQGRVYGQLTPFFAALGFAFHKSHKGYVKQVGNKRYCLTFLWDGRGASSAIRVAYLDVQLLDINRYMREICGYAHET